MFGAMNPYQQQPQNVSARIGGGVNPPSPVQQPQNSSFQMAPALGIANPQMARFHGVNSQPQQPTPDWSDSWQAHALPASDPRSANNPASPFYKPPPQAAMPAPQQSAISYQPPTPYVPPFYGFAPQQMAPLGAASPYPQMWR